MACQQVLHGLLECDISYSETAEEKILFGNEILLIGPLTCLLIKHT